ncbi:hypothetical protein Hdeb2414_s0257g00850111 [Helianthus debilis subsp. tardiflorus]
MMVKSLDIEAGYLPSKRSDPSLKVCLFHELVLHIIPPPEKVGLLRQSNGSEPNRDTSVHEQGVLSSVVIRIQCTYPIR